MEKLIYPYHKKYFEKIFEESDPWELSSSEFQKKKYLRQTEAIKRYFPRVGTILEVGCAAGTYTVILAKTFPGARIIGIDIAHNAIKKAERNCKNYMNIELIEGDIVELFKDGKLSNREFDVVIQSESLYYLFPKLVIRGNLSHYLRNLINTLRRDGIFITSNSVNTLLKLVMGIYYFLLSRLSIPVYTSKYTDWHEIRKKILTYDLRVFRRE